MHVTYVCKCPTGFAEPNCLVKRAAGTHVCHSRMRIHLPSPKFIYSIQICQQLSNINIRWNIRYGARCSKRHLHPHERARMDTSVYNCECVYLALRARARVVLCDWILTSRYVIWLRIQTCMKSVLKTQIEYDHAWRYSQTTSRIPPPPSKTK